MIIGHFRGRKGAPKFWARWLLALQCALLGQMAEAGSYGINPVKLTFSSQNTPQVMTVRNDGEQAAVVQVELAAWTQQEDREVYTPTRDLLANPPIFSIPAGATQIIRVGLRRAPDEHRELAYRLFLQEVPPPPKPDAIGLQVALRISIPVFVAPRQPIEPILQWRAIRLDDHTLQVAVTNVGNGHDHLSAYKIYRGNSETPLLSRQLFAYLLPGTTHYWTQPMETGTAPNPGETLRILTNTEAGEVTVDLVMENP